MSGFGVFNRTAGIRPAQANGHWGIALDKQGKVLPPDNAPLFTNFQPTPVTDNKTTAEPLPFDRHERADRKQQKYAGGTNPVMQEGGQPIMTPPPHLAIKMKNRAYENLVLDAYNKYAATHPERYEAEIQAIATARRQDLDTELSREINGEIVDNFRQWLLKRGSPYDHMRAGWWPSKKIGGIVQPDPTPPKFIKSGGTLSEHPSVLAYLDSFIVSRVDYEADLVNMKLEASHGAMQGWSIDQLWKYYKFVVLGLTPDADLEAVLDKVNIPPLGGPPPPRTAALPETQTVQSGDATQPSAAQFAGVAFDEDTAERFDVLVSNLAQNLAEQQALRAELSSAEVGRQRAAEEKKKAKEAYRAEKLKALQAGNEADKVEAEKKAISDAVWSQAEARLKEVEARHAAEREHWKTDAGRLIAELQSKSGEAQAARDAEVKARREAVAALEKERAEFKRFAAEKEQQMVAAYQQHFGQIQARAEEHHNHAKQELEAHKAAHEQERLALIAAAEASRTEIEKQKQQIAQQADEQLQAAGTAIAQYAGEKSQLSALAAHHQAQSTALEQQNAELQAQLAQLQQQHAHTQAAGQMAQIAWHNEVANQGQLVVAIEQYKAYTQALEQQLAALQPPAPLAIEAHPDLGSASPEVSPLASSAPVPQAHMQTDIPAEQVQELKSEESTTDAVAAMIEHFSDATNLAAGAAVRAKAALVGKTDQQVMAEELAAYFAGQLGDEDELAEDSPTGREARDKLHTEIKRWLSDRGIGESFALSRQQIAAWAKDEYGEKVVATPSRPSEIRADKMSSEEVLTVDKFVQANFTSDEQARIRKEQSLFQLAVAAAQGNGTSFKHLKRALGKK